MQTDPSSGLIIPDDVLEGKLVREAWTEERTKLLRRLMRMIEQDNLELDIMMRCQKCGQMIQFTEHYPDGSPEMVCACKRRVLI